MVCEQCGNILREGATVCDQCGAETGARRAESGASGRRQGRADKPRAGRVGSAMLQENEPLLQDAVLTSKRRPRSEGAGRPSARRGTPPPPTTGRQMGRGKREKVRPAQRMMVNWALVWTIVIALALVGAAGGFVFLKRTEAGQLILARMGKEASAQALWTYGQELLDQGYVERSIETFEKAYAMEPDREDIYERLQQIAGAYEAAGRADAAEEIYVKLYTELQPENPVAYRAVVRLMEDQNRRLELSAFLQLAYEKTGDVSFRRQREDLIPTTPTTDLEAGRHSLEQDVKLQSKEDYDIYYILGEEGVLPEQGTLFSEPIHLTEGTHTLRAVAVSNDLISDELSIQYTITLPVPVAPYASLAPDTYETRQRIWLRYVETEDGKVVKNPKNIVTIYYTIDGQTPTSNSPIYTGEPFYLPGGKSVKVKAVAVNQYGKVSNVMEREYKINIPFKKYFNNTDEFSDFTLMKTSRDAFVKKFGAPLEELEIEETTMPGNCLKLNYAWGEARFYMDESGYVLYSLDTESASMTGPRKTKVGMSETDVTEKFRDMGQTYDQNGDRSIYWDESSGYGKLYHLDAGSNRLDYVYYREDGSTVTLSYHLQADKVTKISLRCAF